MSTKIVSRSNKMFKVEIEIPYCSNMLEGEEGVQKALNEVGVVATGEILQQFDSDGSPIDVAGIRFYAHSSKESKEFQTPYDHRILPFRQLDRCDLLFIIGLNLIPLGPHVYTSHYATSRFFRTFCNLFSSVVMNSGVPFSCRIYFLEISLILVPDN